MDLVKPGKRPYKRKDSNIKQILLRKKQITSKNYNPLNESDIQNIYLKEKGELIEKFANKVKDDVILKELSTILDDYNIQKKVSVPITITGTDDVLKNFNWLEYKKQEYLFLLTLDGGNNIINKKSITKGLLDRSLIHPREVFASAIEDRAKSIILVHNHPGGDFKPSIDDLQNTIRLKEVSELVGIKLIDHIIISKNGHYSFNKNNVL